MNAIFNFKKYIKKKSYKNIITFNVEKNLTVIQMLNKNTARK